MDGRVDNRILDGGIWIFLMGGILTLLLMVIVIVKRSDK